MPKFNADEPVNNKLLPELEILGQNNTVLEEPFEDETGNIVLVFRNGNTTIKLIGDFKLRDVGGGEIKIVDGTIKRIEARKSGDDEWQIDDVGYSVTRLLDKINDGDLDKAIKSMFSGKDRLDGSFFDDKLFGFDKDDNIQGYPGADEIHGGLGDDRLRGDNKGGATDPDAFVFDTQLNAKKNVDKILDFGRGNDSIWLDQSIFEAFGGLAPDTVLPAANFVVGNKALDDDDFIIYLKDEGRLFYDADANGEGGKVLFAILTNHRTLAHDDFLIV